MMYAYLNLARFLQILLGHDQQVDHSLAHIGSRAPPTGRKDRKGVIEWDESLETMKQEKDKAEAVWGKPSLVL